MLIAMRIRTAGVSLGLWSCSKVAGNDICPANAKKVRLLYRHDLETRVPVTGIHIRTGSAHSRWRGQLQHEADVAVQRRSSLEQRRPPAIPIYGGSGAGMDHDNRG